jgi:hypothetical protein
MQNFQTASHTSSHHSHHVPYGSRHFTPFTPTQDVLGPVCGTFAACCIHPQKKHVARSPRRGVRRGVPRHRGRSIHLPSLFFNWCNWCQSVQLRKFVCGAQLWVRRSRRHQMQPVRRPHVLLSSTPVPSSTHHRVLRVGG